MADPAPVRGTPTPGSTWVDANGNPLPVVDTIGSQLNGFQYNPANLTPGNNAAVANNGLQQSSTDPGQPFNPVGWTKTGGAGQYDTYKNDATGATVIVDRNTGRIGGSATSGENAAADASDTPVGGIKDALGAGATALGLDQLIPNMPGGGNIGIPSQASDQIQAAIAQQNALVAQNGQALANYNPATAPTAVAPGAINAAQAGQQAPIQAALAQSQQANASQVGQTALTPQQQAIQAQQIANQQLGPASLAQASTIAPTTVGPTSLAGAATIDQSQQAQLRAAQLGLVGGLQGAIAGTDPSVAAIMLRQATDRNIANQYALAQSATGMNTGLAQRTAMINAADANQTAIGQQALLRAQEIQAARGQLGGVLDSARGADIGLATSQAGLQQQTGLTNVGAQNTSTLTQAQIAAAQAQAQAQLQTGASQFNAGQTNAQNLAGAQLAQAGQIANQQAGLQAATTNTTLAQQAALANAAAQNTTYQTNAQLQQQAGLQNAQLGTQTALANANNQTSANTSSAQLANAVNLANANNQSQANVTAGQLQTQAAIANANNAVSTNALNQKATQDLAGNQLTASGQAGQTSVGYGDVYAKLADAQAKQNASIIGAAGAAAAAL